MGIYNTFAYGSAVTFGRSPKIEDSVSPFSAVAIDYSFIKVSWTNPAGAVLGFRLLRNQAGFPDTQEDGAILIDLAEELPSQMFFNDTEGLVSGQYCYYSIWLLKEDESWIESGRTWCLLPLEHNLTTPDKKIILESSQEKFVKLFPKVYSTAQQSYLDEINKESDFYNFMGGFSFTLDEILTYADLLVPNLSGQYTNPEIVSSQSQERGFYSSELYGNQSQKRLIREAVYLYQHKGTVKGVNALAESVTRYNTTVTDSPNLLLNNQDSSFYMGTGNWESGLQVTLSASTEVTPYLGEPYAVDTKYVGKAVVSSGSNKIINLGDADPKKIGVPVTAGIEYNLSYRAHVSSGTGHITPSITWYNYRGELLGTASLGTEQAVTTGWNKHTQTVTAPIDNSDPYDDSNSAYFASITLSFNEAKTYYLDMVQFAKTIDTSYLNYHEARGVEVYLYPSKTNFVTNPCFESGVTTGWSFNQATASVITNYVSGGDDFRIPGIRTTGKCLKLVTTNTASTYLSPTVYTDFSNILHAGEFYTFSTHLRTEIGSVSGMTLRLSIEDPLLSGDARVLRYNEVVLPTLTTTWQRVSVNIFTTAGLDMSTVVVRAMIYGNGGTKTILMDSSQMEDGYVATDYFDGTLSIRGAEWTGTANSSTSILYNDKHRKIVRLEQIIPEFLPINTAYIITTGPEDSPVLDTGGYSS